MTAYTQKAFRARDLRNAMTEPEVILWSRLKTLRSQGFHIRRQAPFAATTSTSPAWLVGW